MKLVLVDDDYLIREDIKTFFDWKSQNIEIVYEASCGRDAADWLSKHNADIVLTDISMPNGDGIALIRYLKTTGFSGEVVVMSNYDDFNYVKEAMKLGAFDYCLKYKMTPESILELLNAANDHKLGRERIHQIVSRQSVSATLAGIAHGYVSDKTWKSLLAEKALAPAYYLALIYLGNLSHNESFTASEATEAGLVCSHLSERELLAAMDAGKYSASYFENLLQTVEGALNSANQSAVIAFNTSAISLGMIKQKVSELQEIRRTAFYTEKKMIKNERVNKLNAEIPLPDKQRFETGLISAALRLEKEEFERRCNQVISYFSINRIHPSYVCRFFENTVLQITQRLEYGDAHFSLDPDSIGTVGRLREALEQWQQSFFVLPVLSEKQEIINAIHFIQANYMRDISLEEAANTMQMSKNHFCTLFRREVGETYITYLQKLRIEKAKALLKDCKIQVQDVSRMVGIDNTRYFSTLFRKYVGISPSQYRENIR